MLSLSCGIILALFGIGVDSVIKIYGAEQYPTRIRETGIGLFEGAGRLFGGALAPFVMAFLLAGSGVPGSYLFVALLALVGIAQLPCWAQKLKDEPSNTRRRYKGRAKQLILGKGGKLTEGWTNFALKDGNMI